MIRMFYVCMYNTQNFIGNKRSKDYKKEKTVVQRPQKLKKLNGYNYFARECLQSEGSYVVAILIVI